MAGFVLAALLVPYLSEAQQHVCECSGTDSSTQELQGILGKPITLYGSNYKIPLNTVTVIDHDGVCNQTKGQGSKSKCVCSNGLRSLTITRNLLCGDSAYRQRSSPVSMTVTDTFTTMTNGTIVWTTQVASNEEQSFTALISDSVSQLDGYYEYDLWVAGGSKTPVSENYNPIQATRWQEMSITYGAGSAVKPSLSDKAKATNISWYVLENYNAVYAEHWPNVTEVQSAADCQSLCISRNECYVYAWSGQTLTCFFRTDNKWGSPGTIHNEQNRVSGCLLGKAINCGVNPLAPVPEAFSLPLVALINKNKSISVNFVQDISNAPLDALLSVNGSGELQWQRKWFRFGNGTAPVNLRRYLFTSVDCWRPAVDFFVRMHSAAMEVNANVTENDINGGGAYVDYRGENDQRPYTSSIGAYQQSLKKMNFQSNWMTTANWGPSHGLFMPYNLSTYEPFTGNWTSCFGAPDFVSYYQGHSHYNYVRNCWELNYSTLESYSKDLGDLSFTPLLYGNYWEYGWNVSELNIPLPSACDNLEPGIQNTTQGKEDWAFCTTNRFLRNKLPNAPFRQWSNEGVTPRIHYSGMGGAAVLDAGDADYKTHLLRMVSLAIKSVPSAKGIVFDRTGYFGLVNVLADDGKSYIECHDPKICPTVNPGRKVRSQIVSLMNIKKEIGKVLHGSGKAMLWNACVQRADVVKHTDGFFNEIGWQPLDQLLNGFLGVGGKPHIAWNPGCDNPITAKYPIPQCPNELLTNTSAMLQRLMFFGAQPMLPLERNDHGITRHLANISADIKIFEDFGPLFRLMRGRRWWLTPHAVRIISSHGGQANAFIINNNTVLVAIVFGSPSFNTTLSIAPPPKNFTSVSVLFPGASHSIPLPYKRMDDMRLQVDVLLPSVHACGLLQLQ
eukprot:m.50088 g.50088  ORF g.50088 m.50088 type:complete len:898 (-) comp10646_c0_seq3:104-2797(-)